MSGIQIVQADLDDPRHQAAVLAMMDGYAADPMGDARPLSDYTRAHLIDGLREHPTTLVFLAFSGGEACGIATCFRGFSTFAAKPLVNIHDFYVTPVCRGRGVAPELLAAVQAEARAAGCCKLTLEVQSSNTRARAIYEQFGFAQMLYAADAEAGDGGALFMAMPVA